LPPPTGTAGTSRPTTRRDISTGHRTHGDDDDPDARRRRARLTRRLNVTISQPPHRHGCGSQSTGGCSGSRWQLSTSGCSRRACSTSFPGFRSRSAWTPPWPSSRSRSRPQVRAIHRRLRRLADRIGRGLIVLTPARHGALSSTAMMGGGCERDNAYGPHRDACRSPTWSARRTHGWGHTFRTHGPGRMRSGPGRSSSRMTTGSPVPPSSRCSSRPLPRRTARRAAARFQRRHDEDGRDVRTGA